MLAAATDPLWVEPPRDACFDPVVGAWVISRFADVKSALAEPRLSAGPIDPEWHAQYRRAAWNDFGPDRCHAWEPQMEAMAREVFVQGTLDVASDIVRPWALRVACLVTGAEVADADRLQTLSSAVLDAAAEPFHSGLQQQAAEATTELAEFFRDAAIPSLHVQAFVAVAQTLPAFVVNAWLTLLLNRAAEIPVEELLRYAGPSKVLLRRAAGAVCFGSVEIPSESLVFLNVAAANRDPAVFASPNLFHSARRPKHLAVGGGPHACVGSALIRRAAEVGLRVFLAGRQDLVSAIPRPTLGLRLLHSLLLRMSAASA